MAETNRFRCIKNALENDKCEAIQRQTKWILVLMWNDIVNWWFASFRSFSLLFSSKETKQKKKWREIRIIITSNTCAEQKAIIRSHWPSVLLISRRLNVPFRRRGNCILRFINRPPLSFWFAFIFIWFFGLLASSSHSFCVSVSFYLCFAVSNNFYLSFQLVLGALWFQLKSFNLNERVLYEWD